MTWFFSKKPSGWALLLNFALALALLTFLCTLALQTQTYHWKEVWNYRPLFLKGWLTTILLSLAGLILSTLIGVAVAIVRRSPLLLLRSLAQIYIELIRGTPFLVQILFFFYVVANAAGINNRFWVGILTLSLFSGAYIAEIIRAGIQGIPKSQLDSAKAIGFSPWQTYRFVIFPQAFRNVLPALTGQFASLIKDSSLLSIIGISELTYVAQQVNSATYSTLESFFPLAFGYLILTFPISLWSRYLEKKYYYVH